MKNLVKISFVLATFFMCLNVSAQDEQISLGVKAGINLSNIVSSYDGESESADYKIGPIIGLTVDYKLAESLYLLSGLDLSIKGAKETDDDYEYVASPIYLHVPIHAGYKIDLSDNMKLVVDAGPFLAFGIAGKVKVKDDDYDVSTDVFGKEEDGGLKRFDFGFGVGAGLEINKIKIGIGYDWGLTNIDWDKEFKTRTRNGYLTVGYKF